MNTVKTHPGITDPPLTLPPSHRTGMTILPGGSWTAYRLFIATSPSPPVGWTNILILHWYLPVVIVLLLLFLIASCWCFPVLPHWRFVCWLLSPPVLFVILPSVGRWFCGRLAWLLGPDPSCDGRAGDLTLPWRCFCSTIITPPHNNLPPDLFYNLLLTLPHCWLLPWPQVTCNGNCYPITLRLIWWRDIELTCHHYTTWATPWPSYSRRFIITLLFLAALFAGPAQHSRTLTCTDGYCIDWWPAVIAPIPRLIDIDVTTIYWLFLDGTVICWLCYLTSYPPRRTITVTWRLIGPLPALLTWLVWLLAHCYCVLWTIPSYWYWIPIAVTLLITIVTLPY